MASSSILSNKLGHLKLDKDTYLVALFSENVEEKKKIAENEIRES